MAKLNYPAVLLSAVVAFVTGGLWYSPLLFGRTYTALRGLDPANAAAAMPAGEMVGEFARWLVLAFIFAHFMGALYVNSIGSALLFGLLTWVAIYTALAGSVLHEAYPWRLYAIHAGDGLVKILIMVSILATWRAR